MQLLPGLTTDSRWAKTFNNVGPCFLLFVGRLAVDGDRAAVVGKVAAERRAEIKNVKLTIFDLPIAGRATHLSRGIVVAGPGQGFAVLHHCGGLQLVENFQFVDPGTDDLAGLLVHLLRTADCHADLGDLVGVFFTALAVDLWFDVDQLGLELVDR